MTIVAFRNRHPADALADVRDEINQLRIQEAELRQVLLATQDEDRCGVQYDAVVANGERKHLDEKALVEHFGIEALQPFYRIVAFKTVRLKRHKHNATARNPRVYAKDGLNACSD
jgi:hypothetical protein